MEHHAWLAKIPIAGAVHEAAIVPNHRIADTPLMLINPPLIGCGKVNKLVEQGLRFVGFEADYVLVTDLSTDSHGFPSTKNDDPVLKLILPEIERYPDAEERRLLYVAMTRAREEVHLLSSASNPSSFALELNENDYAIVDHSRDDGVANKCPSCESGFVVFVDFNNGFYGCSNHPICDYSEAKCPSCSGRVLRLSGSESSVCTNNQCAQIFEACPRCRSGAIIPKKGQNVVFEGCNTWPTCNFTRSIRS
jgi:DNA helicase-4